MMRFFTLLADIWKALPFQAKTLAFAGIGVLIVLIIVFGQIGACRTRREERKIEETKTNIQTSQIEANVLENRQQEVEQNANDANGNINAVFGTDSGGRDTDFGTVRAKWCREHPADSKCSSVK